MNFLKAASLAGGVMLSIILAPAQAAIIGIDAVHGFDADGRLTGGDFEAFRATITGMGHTLVDLNSFDAATLSGVDAAIVLMPYDDPLYSASDISALNNFASERAAFVSDSSMWTDFGAGSDRSIFFGDNRVLLQNIVNFLVDGGGALYIGDGGTGFQPSNFNQLVAAYGISFALQATEGQGHTVTQFNSHEITDGLNAVGVDFQLRMDISNPSVDLTLLDGADNMLAVFEASRVPVPGTLFLVALGLFGFSIKHRVLTRGLDT